MEQRKRKDVLICIDEAHRLTTGNFGRYHSIIVEMSREIRDNGMLWVTTQNYTDIPDSIRNQFASQFMFKSTCQNDMIALKAIEPLPWYFFEKMWFTAPFNSFSWWKLSSALCSFTRFRNCT